MNKQIKALNQKLASIAGDASEIETQLQAEWNKVFADMTVLKDAVAKLESSNEYGFDEDGEIVSWIAFDTSPFKGCEAYLVEYLRFNHCVEIDFFNNTLQTSHGDCIVIQDDTRRDNAVYLGYEVIIQELEYLDEDGKVDEVKRNALIEAYMEKMGGFSGVFRTDSYGNVFPVSTLAK